MNDDIDLDRINVGNLSKEFSIDNPFEYTLPIVLCKNCIYFLIRPGTLDLCSNPEAPISNFVNGNKYCFEINKEGHCKYHKEK